MSWLTLLDARRMDLSHRGFLEVGQVALPIPSSSFRQACSWAL
jgi:hypothetical protein